MTRQLAYAFAVVAALSAALPTAPARAAESARGESCQPPIPGELGRDAAGCPIAIDPYAKLVFASSDHRAWYGRFWTGKCDGLSFWQSIRCQPGEPAWNELVDRTLARVPAGHRPYLRYVLWRLGRLIGFEWAKDNVVRKIDTDELRTWFGWLDKDRDVDGALNRISKAVHNALKRPPS